MQSQAIDRTAAGLLIVLTGLFALKEWGVDLPSILTEGTALLVIALLSLSVRMTRKAFVLAGIGLSLWLALAGEPFLLRSERLRDRAAIT